LKRILSLCALCAPIAILISAGAATLNAQNVAVDKTSLSFSAQFGGAPVSQALTVTSSNGSAISFFTFTNVTWIKVNGLGSASGTTPSTVTVSADPTGLASGTYTTSLSVFGGANNVSVAISFTVSTIGVNPSTISFGGYTAGSTSVPAAQSITLSGASTAFTAVATTTSGGNWLQVTPTAGTSPGAVTAVLNSAIVPGMAVGTYQGKITITPSGGTTNIPVEIPVTFTIASAPVITVTPTPLQFNVQIGGTNNLTSQTFTIAVAPPAQLSYGFTASVDPNPAGKNWILINPPAGSTNATTGIATVTISVDTAGLPANTYNGKITLITPGGSPTQQDIPVRLVISNSPLLNIPTAALNFTAQLGAATPPAQTVNVTATSGTLAYTVSASAGASWLTVSPTSGTTAAPFSVSVNPSGLAPGTYTATLTVTGTISGSGSQQIPVTLKVSNDPLIVTNLSSLSFPFQIGQSTPAGQLLKITSSTGATLNYQIVPTQTNCTTANWLVVNGNTGANVNGSTDASLVVSVNPAGLPAGTCTGNLAVTATVASSGVTAVNSPVNIPVSLYVSNTALIVLTPNAPPVFNVALGAQAPAPQNISIGSTSPTDALNYNASFSTTTGGSWLFVGPLSGSTGSNNVLTISVIPTLLSAGTYSGTITVTATSVSGAAVTNSPVTIPVVLNVTAGSITLSATTLNYTYTLGGSSPAAQTVTIGSSAAALTYSAVAASTGSWLTVTPANGNTSSSGTISIGIDGTKLTAPGTYSGTITVTAPGAGNSPATINVTVTVGGGALVAPTTTLTFTQVTGGPVPAAQSIAVTGSPGSLNFTTSTSAGTPWLTVSPPAGTTPGSVLVSATAGSMPVGQYNGSVIITSPGASGSPITVPVVFNVVGSQSITANPTSLTFTYNIGQTAPAAQSLVVNSTGTGAAISAQVQYTGTGNGGWLQVTPPTSTAPTTLTVTASPGSLSAGTYNATINITSTSALNALNVPVTLTVNQIPKPVITAIGNAASYSTGGVSPGENIVIFGTGIGPAAVVSGSVTNNVWSTTTGNTRVLFDGVAAPVIYSSATQTSVMVPYGVNGRTTTSIVVEYSGVQSNPISFNVVPAAPGIYTLNQQGNGPGAILNQNGVTVNGSASPAPRGNVVSVYMTGEGQTNPPGVDGAIIPAVLSALKNPVLKVTATIGGIDAPVQYAGSAAGLISGVMQVNVMIPANAPVGGQVPIVITVGSAATQAGVTIAVQ
jgi:uncharacterized protein (TIGR03437 family)